ncbi:MAG: hypothetical protein V4506_12625 [Bacteroidota bacterium]
MAEFNLPGNVYLTINGIEHSKDDILKIIEDLKGQQFMYLHRAIFHNKEILLFFEEPTKPASMESLVMFFDTLKTNPDYSRLQELLRDALNERFKHYLSSNDYIAYKEYSRLNKYLEPFQKMQLYEVIRKHLLNLIYFLSSYHDKRIRTFDFEVKLKTDVAFIYEKNISDFLNDLPKEFEELNIAVNEALFHFIKYCYDYYELSPEFYYKTIDEVMRINNLNTFIRGRLYYYKDMIRELDNQLRYIPPPSSPRGMDNSASIAEEWERQTKEAESRPRESEAQRQEKERRRTKTINREFRSVKIINSSLMLMVIFIILAFIMAYQEIAATIMMCFAGVMMIVAIIYKVRQRATNNY